MLTEFCSGVSTGGFGIKAEGRVVDSPITAKLMDC
ncbi:MAG TPA: hypothetical protein DCL61_18505 [Cyanobacteria bacterium UBA12227]|nr:hypothetical protein [Cyanobacteria bacterium UBA12227]HAX85366.1 hypothetical protein [Cyanobacteria bacterium UBA11370]HBY77445.1 hypothetical protein [Cyanobacteria bacterium UBA11148]